jgi:hypothetical protein
MKASSSRTTEFGKMFTAAVMNDGPIFVASIVGCQSGHMAQRCYCWSFSDIWFRSAVLISRLKNIVGWFVVKKNTIPAEKTSWKVRIISQMNKAIVYAKYVHWTEFSLVFLFEIPFLYILALLLQQISRHVYMTLENPYSSTLFYHGSVVHISYRFATCGVDGPFAWHRAKIGMRPS